MSKGALGTLRILAGIAAIVLGLVHPFPDGPGQALAAALVTVGVVILVYFGIDLYWESLLGGGTTGAAPDVAAAWGPFVGLIVTTAGVVLGLLKVFASASPLPAALKVATFSLAATMVFGMMLFGLVVSATPTNASALVFRAAVFNLTLTLLALGLLAIAWSAIYQ